LIELVDVSLSRLLALGGKVSVARDSPSEPRSEARGPLETERDMPRLLDGEEAPATA
jgi:hypothetical protein